MSALFLGDGPGCQYPLHVCSELGRAVTDGAGTFLVVQQLGLCTSTARGLRFDPWSGNYIPHATTKSSNAATKTQHSEINERNKDPEVAPY